ncbi:MAG: terminase [Oscillospiraceae bacterium]|nr:terminase [Oscillospiraceae bacterium]
MDVRKGRQTPTLSVVLPYEETHGQEAVDLYNSTTKTAQEWQELLLYDMLAYNDEGLWIHTKFGYSVPRRNGKNEVVMMREAYGLVNGERIIHTAHRTKTSHSAWERLCDFLSEAGVQYDSWKALGSESIEVTGGGRIDFRTRSSKGGLGEGFDLLVVDEAQEYTPDEESALKYVVSDSLNPQTIYCGTPPTPISSGTVFAQYRQDVMLGKKENSAWAEWSVDRMSDVHDRELWYEANPSMGTVLTERKVADEIGDDDVDFNIQRLGLWLKYNQKSAISRNEWLELKCKRRPQIFGKLSVGIKFGLDGANVAMGIAVVSTKDRIFLEAIGCRPVREGLGWIIDFLRNADWNSVVIDGKNGEQMLVDAMKAERLKKPILPSTDEIIVANAVFEQAICSKTICHMDQPSLTQIVSNCEKRPIGSRGGFGYKSLKAEAEISLLDCVMLAHWACTEKKHAKPKQKIRY